MSTGVDGWAKAYGDVLAAWVGGVARHARLVTGAGAVLTLAALIFFVDTIGINTSTSDMLSDELAFRRHANEIDRAFPQTDGTLAVVIDGQTADIADDAALVLGAELRKRPALFKDVYDLKGDPFFRQNGLLYLDVDELSELADRLAEAQPFLSALWRDSSLRGLFRMLGLGIDEALKPGGADAFDLSSTLNAMAEVAEAQNHKRFQQLSWTRLMGGINDTAAADRRRFIVVKPARDQTSLQPGTQAIQAIRQLAGDLGLTPERGLTVRLTGSAALDEEELESVAEGMGLAAVISLVLVLGLLFVGLRSLRLVLANLGTLIAGLILTAAFAALAIGTLNLISVAFAVLFIGLSVDFGIHFALCYREKIWRGYDQHTALAEAARVVGGSLTLCALSAAIAFFAFLPTDYVGLAELGLIAGSGMFIALFANLTLLPALIAMTPLGEGGREAQLILPAAGARAGTAIRRHARAICWVALVLGVAAAAVAPRAEFDFDPLNLKDPNTESVATLFDLMSDGSRNHHTIEVLSADQAAAEALKARLGKIELVDKAVTLASYVPKSQEEKLDIIGDMALFIAPALALAAPAVPLNAQARLDAWAALRTKLQALSERSDAAGAASARRLLAAVSSVVGGDRAATALLDLENRLLAGLPGRLDALNQSLRAEAVTISSLPQQLQARNVAADGRALIEVYPREALSERAAVGRFVDAVRAVAPNAVGSPVVILEAGRTVLRAFAEAGALAVIFIVVLLAFVMRRVRDVAMVFAPLLLAGIWTAAAAALLGVAFNLANVIVLPLLFGLGVAGAIHLVARSRESDGVGEALRTSTPRAVLFSALTTIGSFGSIYLSSHPGTASMGLLLSLAITLTLISTLVFLPALLVVCGLGDKSEETQF